MEYDDTAATTEDLDVSMTQQSQLLFIPFSLAVSLGVGMFACGIFFHTWRVIFIFPPLWVGAYLLTKRDHNAIRVAAIQPRLVRVWVTAHHWGGWSISPPSPQASRSFLKGSNGV